MPEVASPAPASPAPAPVPAAKSPEPKAPVEAKKEGEAPKEEAKPAPKPTHKFKFNGEEKEVPLEELEKHYGTFATAQARLKEAAEAKKKIAEERQSLIDALKKGDASKLKDAGLSDDEIDMLAVQHLSKKQQELLEQERLRSLDPEQRELEELRKLRADLEKEKQKEADARRAAEVKDEERRIATNVIASLETLPEKFKRQDFIAQRVFDAWEYFEQNKEQIEASGFNTALVTPEFIAKKVLAEVRSLHRQMLEDAKDEDLDEMVPDSVAGRVLQRRQSKAREDAHPALTAEPQFGDGKKKEEKPERAPSTAQLMRRAYFGGSR